MNIFQLKKPFKGALVFQDQMTQKQQVQIAQMLEQVVNRQECVVIIAGAQYMQPRQLWWLRIKNLFSTQVKPMDDLCSRCRQWYPYPVEYHHTRDECMANIARSNGHG